MKKLLNRLTQYYRRATFMAIGVLLAFAGLLPSLILTTGTVHANGSGGQIQSRSITMSSSTPGATGVTYKVTFTPQTNETHPDVIVDFCSNDPLIGDSCTATAGTDTPNFTTAAATGWTVTPIGSDRGVYLTTSSVSFSSGTPVTITLTGVTNPSNTASFYGRILDYATGAGSSFDGVTPGPYVDWGGIALSTTQNITVQSKVFETLSFCVYSGTCGTQATLDLGNGTTGALSTGTAYVNSGASYSIATNAYHGVVVTMTGQTLCNQATLNFTNCPTGASANTISAIGTTAHISSVGTSQFGMCTYNGGNANITVASTYDDTVNNCSGITTGSYSGSSLFGFDDSNTTGTNSANGSQVMSSTGALTSTTGNFAFLGNITAITTAGIYNSNLNLVATGTF